MDQIFDLILKYGNNVPVGMLFLYIIMRVGKAGGVPTITIRWGNVQKKAEQDHGNNGNGSGGNGNGKLTEADVAKLISLHHNSCSTELFRKIDAYNQAQQTCNEEVNRSLGRIEGILEAKK